MTNTSDSIKMTAVNDLDDFFEDFPRSFWTCFKNVIDKEGYLKYSVQKKAVPQAGNFLSFLYEIDIEGVTPEGEKRTSLFLKKAVKIDKITLSSVFDLYSQERIFYNDIYRTFLKIQESANIPDEDKFKFIKSYDSDNEVIIMENLTKKGFKSYDGKQAVTRKFAELAMVELAKFHAFSYILKVIDPKYFDDKIKVIKHPYNLDSDWDGFLNNLCAETSQVLKGEAAEKIKQYSLRMIETNKKYVHDIIPSNGCLCHGDYKILNILVKEAEGNASEVQIIDFQIIYYGSPVNDFLYFVFTGTDREFRRKHLSDLKDLYFENFAKFLKHFDIDVDSAYSRREFDKDYEERFEMGLVYGLYLSAFSFAHIDEGFDVNKLSLSELKIVPDEQFTERVQGIVDDYIEWGYL